MATSFILLTVIAIKVQIIGSELAHMDDETYTKSYEPTKPILCPLGHHCAETTTDATAKYLRPKSNTTYPISDVYINKKKRIFIEAGTDTISSTTMSNVIPTRSSSKSNSSVVVVYNSNQPKRRKTGESGAPLLNYIFDTYSNTHQHRSERPSNTGNIYAVSSERVQALVGSDAHLDCIADMLQDKVVSWVRRKSDGEMELLTTGTQKYTSDERYSCDFAAPNIWRLLIKSVEPSDAAEYDCQLSAHPPRFARLFLDVPEVTVTIVDEQGVLLREQVCEAGSTVALRCEVRGLDMSKKALHWYRKKQLLNDDTTRGGVSVVVRLGHESGNAILRVAKVKELDAGEYECRVLPAPKVNVTISAKAHLYVIKGENNLAELHQGNNSHKRIHPMWTFLFCFTFLKMLFIQ